MLLRQLVRRQISCFPARQATLSVSLESSAEQCSRAGTYECKYGNTLREALDVKYLKPRQPLSGVVTTCTLVICLEYKCSRGEELSFVPPSLKRALELLLFALGSAFSRQFDA